MNYRVHSNDELYHFGIQGMKWGIRRYQNEDGTLTEEGKKRLRKDIHNVDFNSSRGLKRKIVYARAYKNPILVEEKKKLALKRKELEDAWNKKDLAMEEFSGNKEEVRKAFREYYKMNPSVYENVKDDLMSDETLPGKTLEEKLRNYEKEVVEDPYIARNYFNYTDYGKKLTEEVHDKWSAYNEETKNTVNRLMKELGDMPVPSHWFDDEFPDNDKNRKRAQEIVNRSAGYRIADILQFYKD